MHEVAGQLRKKVAFASCLALPHVQVVVLSSSGFDCLQRVFETFTSVNLAKCAF